MGLRRLCRRRISMGRLGRVCPACRVALRIGMLSVVVNLYSGIRRHASVSTNMLRGSRRSRVGGLEGGHSRRSVRWRSPVGRIVCLWFPTNWRCLCRSSRLWRRWPANTLGWGCRRWSRRMNFRNLSDPLRGWRRVVIQKRHDVRLPRFRWSCRRKCRH